MKTSWLKRNENSLKFLYFDLSDSFKDDISKLSNHSAMTVDKFTIALSDQFKFHFVPSVLHGNEIKLNYKNWQLICVVSLR